MLKRKAEVFAPTDGVVSICTDHVDRQVRGADFSSPLLLEEVFPLAFRRMRISSRDVELSESTGAELTAKLEVRNVITLDVGYDAVLNGKVHEITRVESRGHTCWLWLSEIATDGTCDLVQETYTYDAVGVPKPTKSTPVTVYARQLTPGAKRRSGSGVDTLEPTVTLRLRKVDYAGEQHLTHSDRTYTVMTTEGHGKWVDLTCRERGADRG